MSLYIGFYSNGTIECGWCKQRIRENVLAVRERFGSQETCYHFACAEKELHRRKEASRGGEKIDLSNCRPDGITDGDYNKLRNLVMDHNSAYSLDLKNIRVGKARSDRSHCFMCFMWMGDIKKRTRGKIPIRLSLCFAPNVRREDFKELQSLVEAHNQKYLLDLTKCRLDVANRASTCLVCSGKIDVEMRVLHGNKYSHFNCWLAEHADVTGDLNGLWQKVNLSDPVVDAAETKAEYRQSRSIN